MIPRPGRWRDLARSCKWDVLNRLVRIDNPDATFSAYRYDAQGRRIEKDVNGALTRYVYDDDAILLEYDGANGLQATWSHGEEVDQPLAMARGGGSYLYHTDHLGSVRLLTDAAGAVVSRYDYDSFGNLEATSFEGVANPYGFTARERDAESGLMFYRARYYDPKIGRFISEDAIGCISNDLNLYRYVSNSPTIFIDPSGKSQVLAEDAAVLALLVFATAVAIENIGNSLGEPIVLVPSGPYEIIKKKIKPNCDLIFSLCLGAASKHLSLFGKVAHISYCVLETLLCHMKPDLDV